MWVSLELSQFHFLHNPQLFVIPFGAGRTGGRIPQPRSVERCPEQRLPLLGAGCDLRLVNRRHVHCRPGQQLVVAAGAHGALGVAGMLAGIMFRVRSFLFLGFTFLVLDFSSMIW